MAEVEKAAPAMPVGMEAALAEVRAKALKEGEAEGYAKGRADACAIFASAEAKGREALAAELAGQASITPTLAASLLSKATAAEEKKQEATPAAFAKIMEGNKTPDVGANPPPADAAAARAERSASLKAMAQSVSARR